MCAKIKCGSDQSLQIMKKAEVESIKTHFRLLLFEKKTLVIY